MKGSSRAVLLGALVALLTPAQSSWGQESRPRTSIAVVPLRADEDRDERAAEALSDALQTKLRSSAQFTTLERPPSLGTFTTSFACGTIPDTRCQQRIADHLKVDTFVWGRVGRTGGSPFADVHLYRRGDPESSQREPFTDSASAVAERILERLSLVEKPKVVDTPREAPAPVEEPSQFPTRTVVGVSVGIVGIGLGVLAVERFSKYASLQSDVDALSAGIQDTNGEARSACSVSGPNAALACQKSHEAVTASTVGILAASGAVVALGVAAVLLFYPSTAPTKSAVRLRSVPMVSPQTAGLMFVTAF